MFSDRLKVDNLEDTLSLAKEYTASKHILFNTDSGDFLIYRDGIWHRLSEEELRLDIINTIQGAGRFPYAKMSNVIGGVKTLMHCKQEQFNRDGMVNFINGTYCVNEFKFKAHDPEDMLTIYLPYFYDEKAYPKLWIKTLDEIFEGKKEYVMLLQEFFGYCLTKTTKFESVMFFVGMGGNGKGVIMDTLKYMIGDQNCSALSLNQLADEVTLSGIINKMVNMSTEVSQTSKDYEDVVKALTSGNELTVSPKYVKPFKIKPYCKLIFSCNTFPRINDKTNAFFDRLLLIEFNINFRTRPDVDRDLTEKLKDELPGILNWSIEGLKRLYKQNKFTKGQYMKNSIEHLSIENNQVKHFCIENVSIKDGFYVTKKELYAKYVQWAKENGHKNPMSSISFNKEIFNLYHHKTSRDKRLNSLTRDCIWENIVLNGFDNQITQTWEE